MQIIRRLWIEEDGYILSTELVLVGSLLVVGIIGGMTTMRDSLVGEMSDLSSSVSSLDQSFSVVGIVEGRDNLGRNGLAYAAGNFNGIGGYGEYDSNGRALSFSAGSAFFDNTEKDQASRKISSASVSRSAGTQTLASVMSPELSREIGARIAAKQSSETVQK
ncbi:MAG: hypothetical protein KF708_10800 [Pirellulales bacterium]|nr:hypothetical protein [Pirellulales bacterium]